MNNSTRDTTDSQPQFFGRLPERAFLLREGNHLKPRDMEVLAWLTRRAATGNVIVTERQESLAGRLGCVVKTIQRALARLETFGFLVRLYARDAGGRLHGRGYDVSATLAMFKPSIPKPSIPKPSIPKPSIPKPSIPKPSVRPEAKIPHQQANTKTPQNPASTKATLETNGKSGLTQNHSDPADHQSDSDVRFLKETLDSVQEDKTAAPLVSQSVVTESSTSKEPAQEANPVVVTILTQIGIAQTKAEALAKSISEAKAQEAITAAHAAQGVRNLAGWVIRWLERGWGMKQTASDPHMTAASYQGSGTVDLMTILKPLYTSEDDIRAAAAKYGKGPVLDYLAKRLSSYRREYVPKWDKIERVEAIRREIISL